MIRFIFILLFIFIVIPYLLRVASRLFFGNPTPSKDQNQQRTRTTSQSTPKKKKVISEEEGEYVDFEEIKNQ